MYKHVETSGIIAFEPRARLHEQRKAYRAPGQSVPRRSTTRMMDRMQRLEALACDMGVNLSR